MSPDQEMRLARLAEQQRQQDAFGMPALTPADFSPPTIDPARLADWQGKVNEFISNWKQQQYFNNSVAQLGNGVQFDPARVKQLRDYALNKQQGVKDRLAQLTTQIDNVGKNEVNLLAQQGNPTASLIGQATGLVQPPKPPPDEKSTIAAKFFDALFNPPGPYPNLPNQIGLPVPQSTPTWLDKGYPSYSAYLAADAQQKQAESNRSLSGDILSTATSLPGIGQVIGALGAGLENVGFQPYYSGSYDRAMGGDLLSQLRAAIGGLPGLGFVRNSDETARRAGKLAEHPELRQALHDFAETGDAAKLKMDPRLAGVFGKTVEEWNRLVETDQTLRNTLKLAGKTFGENVTSHKRGALLSFFETPKEMAKFEQTRLPDFIPVVGGKRASGIADIAFQVGADPLTWATFGTSGLAKVTEIAGEQGARRAAADIARELGASATKAALNPEKFFNALAGDAGKSLLRASEQAGREAFLETSRGKSLLRGIEQRLVEPNVINSVEAVQKAIPGLARPQAEDLVRAALGRTNDAGLSAARKVVEKAIIEGTYHPEITIRRQFLSKFTEDAVGARGVPLVFGPKTLGSQGRVRRFLEAVGRGDGADIAGLRYREPDLVTTNAINRALAHTGETPADFYRRAVAPEVARLDPIARLQRVGAAMEQVPYLDDLLQAEYQRLTAGIDKAVGAQGVTDFQRLLSSPEGEAFLQRMESVVAVLDGKATGVPRSGLKNVEMAAARAADQLDIVLRKGWEVPEKSVSDIVGQAKRLALRPGERKGPGVNAFIPDVLRNGGRTIGPEQEWAKSIRHQLRALKKQADYLKGLVKDDAEEQAVKAQQVVIDGQVRRLRARLRSAPSGSPAARDTEDQLADLLANRPLLPSEQRKQMRAELRAQQKDLKAQLSDRAVFVKAEKAINKAADDAIKGLGFKKGIVENTPANRAFLQARIATLVPPGELQDAMLRELAQKGESKSLTGLAKNVEHVASNPTLLETAAKLADNNVARRAAFDAASEARVGLGKLTGVAHDLVAKGARGLLAIDESLPGNGIRFESSPNEFINRKNRAQDMDRFMASLGFDPNTRAAFIAAGQAAKTEEDLFILIKEAYVTFAEESGVSPEGFLNLLDDKMAKAHGQPLFKVNSVKTEPRLIGAPKVIDADVERGVQVIGQRVNTMPILSPSEVKNLVRRAKAIEGDRIAQAKLLGSSLARPAAVTYKKVHSFWKLAVVTNTQLAVPLAAFGFYGTEGSFGDRLKGAAQGFALGSLGGVRYVARLAGIEERLVRYLFERPNVEEFIPGISRWRATAGIDLPFRTVEDVAPQGAKHLTNRMLTSIDNSTWEVLTPKNARYLDGWGRIVNYQINPEAAGHDLERIALEWRAGLITEAQFRRGADEYLASEAGQVWFNRMRGALGGPKNAEDAVQRTVDYVFAHLNDDLARLRLQGPIDRGVLKDTMKAGFAPEGIQAQRTWVIPKNFRDALATQRQLTAKMFLEGPTKTMNREPLARWIYHDEYKTLVRGGVDAEMARNIAEEVAVKRTNALMFNLADESKLAFKLDLAFPFQQPREEMLRVYGKLAVNNPAKTFKWTRLAARAFDNGARSGMFYEDPNNNQWYMTIPGSAFLSRVMTGHDIPMQFQIKDLVFLFQGFQGQQNFAEVDNVVQGLAKSVLPRPGGPFWSAGMRMAFNSNPDFAKSMVDSWWYDKLFPYGNTGFMFRPEARRAFMGFMFSPAPWEFASRFEQENELKRWTIQITQELIYEHLRENPTDTAWLPDPKEVQRATMDFFKMWAGFGAIFPAGTQPKFPFKEWKQNLVDDYKSRFSATEWFSKLMEDHPEAAPFLSKTTEYTDPEFDTFEKWKAGYEQRVNGTRDNSFFEDYTLHHKRYLSYDAFVGNLKESRTTAEMWKEYSNVTALAGNLVERDRVLDDLFEKYPQLRAALKNSYLETKELANILKGIPVALQQEAINKWRQRFDVSYPDYQRILLNAKKFEVNLMQEARDTDIIFKDIKSRFLDKSLDEMPYVYHLPVAEQYKYAQARLDAIHYDWAREDKWKETAAQAVLDEWHRWTNFQRRLRDANPALERSLFTLNFDGTPRDNTEAAKKFPLEGQQTAAKADARTRISDAYESIDRITAAMKEAINSKSWKVYYNLKAQRTDLYSKIAALRNQLYKSTPDVRWAQDEVKATFLLLTGTPKERAQAQNILTKIFAKYDASPREGLQLLPSMGFLSSDEEQSFLRMPKNIRQAYVDDLVYGLQKDPAKFEKGKIFYDYLTNFQKDLLELNLPADQIALYKREVSSDKSTWRNGAGGSGGRGGFRRGGSSQPTELQFAFDLMKQYTQRPAGAKPPAAYQEYLNLPQNPAVRAQFLKANPDVAAWIKSGPLANMPELYRYLVVNTMVKYGKWQGEEKSIQDITELAWARQQLDKWNKRDGMSRPETYDLWLNMPTGVEKAQYLDSHPEIGDWLRMGPMANMPDAYKEVVRDIMTRYGEWTANQDPLGVTLSAFYSTPSYARNKFLEEHPELVSYFAALRSPEEQRMFNMAQGYFALKDGTSRALYMSAHPELTDYFLQSRQKRYEKFLTQVAMFMGSAPELFNTYLQRQTDILGEILHRYATPALVREVPKMRDATSATKSTADSGRIRR